MQKPNRPHTFLDLPLEVGVSDAAQPEFNRYCAAAGLTDKPDYAMGLIVMDHMEHVFESAALHKSFLESSVGGVFCTDVEDYDLAILDVMLPMVDQRRVTVLVTRQESIEQSADLIKRVAASGLIAEEHKPDEPPTLH